MQQDLGGRERERQVWLILLKHFTCVLMFPLLYVRTFLYSSGGRSQASSLLGKHCSTELHEAPTFPVFTDM